MVALISVILGLPFIKYFKPTALLMKRVFIIQIYGTISFLAVTIISAESPTLYMLTTPLAIAFTILATSLTTKKEKYSNLQYIGAFTVFVGILAFSVIQMTN